MKCSKAHKLISLYIDGELPEQDMKIFEDHMNICHKCRAEFEGSRELHKLFIKADEFKAPYGFHTKVMANISSGKAVRFSGIPVFLRFAEAAAIIVVIVFGILSGSTVLKGYPTDKTRDVMASLSLDVFDSAPPDSLAGAYLAMMEVRNEK
ncbi:MAG: hypothetical protein A2X59_11875 [Nitrospirae bacterium GWC2_42_7]|nr:MAG: hypothetical protein A2X59_11875 [Nitrospirae bacterium GWC2_42_7]